MSKFAIVGGSGFVGTRLIKNLRKNNVNYKCFDIRSSFFKDDFIKLDIELPEDLNLLEGYDVIVNLAAEHRDDVKPVSRYDDVNVQGAINICEAARKNNINRMTGLHETSSFHQFTYGYGTRNTSIRIGNDTVKNGKGYFEDRRPASNMDPYIVTGMIFKTACNITI